MGSDSIHLILNRFRSGRNNDEKSQAFSPYVNTPLRSPAPRYYMPLFISSLPLTIPHVQVHSG